MLIIYMVFWSVMMITAISLWQVRTRTEILLVTLVTTLVLIVSQSLFLYLSQLAGANPNLVLADPTHYFSKGVVAWLALLVMPCGWLGPIIGLHLVQKRGDPYYEYV